MQQKVTSEAAKDFTEVEWQARVDLAAAHRIAVMEDLHEGIFNHLTLRVPGKDRYYQIPFGTHWCEVTASCFMEVDYDGVTQRGSGHLGERWLRRRRTRPRRPELAGREQPDEPRRWLRQGVVEGRARVDPSVGRKRRAVEERRATAEQHVRWIRL